MMKRSDIRNAYDQMTPSREQKDRMLSAIMKTACKEQSGKGKYLSGHAQQMGNWIPAAAALVLVLFLGSVVFGRMNASDSVLAPGVLEDPTLGGTVVSPEELQYEPVLQLYRTALQEGWTEEQCLQSNLSFRFASTEYAKANAGYCFLDLDGNGVEELLVGHAPADGFKILDIHTVASDGTIQSVATTADHSTTFSLYEGNVICVDSTTKNNSDVSFYSWSLDTGFHILDGITSDGDNYYDVVNDRPLSAKEAFTVVMEKYQKVCPELTMFADVLSYFRDNLESVEWYLPILEKYKTALLENWSWEQCDAANISRQIMFDSPRRNNLGWCLMDIDSNGVQELVIGDGENLFDLYTLMPTDGQPGLVLSGYPYHYALCRDGTIERRISNGEFTYWSWFRLYETEYLQEYKLTLDNQKHAYYLAEGDGYPVQITEEKAGQYLAGKEKASMELELVPFEELKQKAYCEPNVFYEPIIETYYQAIRENWDPGKCVENGLSLMIGYYGDLYEKLGHNQMDLNGDGNDELIITDGTNIYDLYTVIHDETDGALRLLDATERKQYFLLENGTIYCKGSGGAALGYHTVYHVGQHGLNLQEYGFLYDASENPDQPWYYYDGETKGEPCLDIDVMGILDSYRIQPISFIPFQ